MTLSSYHPNLICTICIKISHIIILDYKLLQENANWSSEIRAIRNANGFDKLFSKLQCNLEIVKSRITINIDIESWDSDVRKKNKLRTYVTFKNEFIAELYLLNPIQICCLRN